MNAKAVPWERAGGEIAWGEDNPIEAAPELTEEDKYVVQQKMAALDKLLESNKKAKYKIELMFGKARSLRRPTPGALSFWESGTQFHGGGDTKIYMCPGKHLGKNECEAFIPFAGNGYGFQLCPECKQVWTGDQVIGEVFCVLMMRGWSEAVLKYFLKLGFNADIYVKMSKQDIRAAALLEQQRQLKGEKLDLVRDDRPKYIYPLKAILKDTSTGADLLGRLYAFLTA